MWRDCVAWLIQCKVIPPDHKANWPDSEIKILAVTLRDGVLLCHLINFLDPTCLDNIDFHRKPQMAQVGVSYCRQTMTYYLLIPVPLSLIKCCSSCATKT